MLALSQFSAGSFADAVNSFGAIAGLAMQDQRTAYSYAFALARIGRAQEANRIADDLAAQPLDVDLLPLVCHIYIDTENYNGSQSCYRKALAQNPNLPLAHYEIGESLIRLDRPAEAVPELRQELLVTPNDPNVLTALAFALLQISQKAEARSLLETAVKASPEHAQSQYELGRLLLEEGDVANAITHLERSEASDASKDYVHYQLATAYRKAARPEDAQRELRTYRQIKDSTRDANATPH
jgi:predicted Zn-dependent protease